MLFNWFCPDRFEQSFYEGYLAGIGRKLQLFKLLINLFGCKQSVLIKRVRDFVIQIKSKLGRKVTPLIVSLILQKTYNK